MKTAIRNVTVVDPETSEVRAGRTLLFEDGKISAEIAADEALGADVEVFEGGGKFALAGMIDAHIHLRAVPHVGPKDDDPAPNLLGVDRDEITLDDYIARAQTFLYCGVTSVYDAGNDPDVIFALREQEQTGAAMLPRIYATGNLLTAPGGHGCGAGVLLPEGGDIEGIVAEHAAKNPDVVKITYDEHGWGVRPVVPLLSKEMLKRTIDAIHSHGKKVTVHVSHEYRAIEAVEAGADILAHPVIQSPMNPSFAEDLAKAGVPVVSTLTIGDRYPRLADNPEYVDGPLYKECESAEERLRLKTEESETQRNNRWADWMRTMTPIAQDNVRVLVEAGVTVGAGTDQAFGPDYHRELELLAGGGITNWQVLYSATAGAAIAVDREGEIGTLKPGAWADVLLVENDPTKDLKALRELSAVFKNGVKVDLDALDIPVNRGTN